MVTIPVETDWDLVDGVLAGDRTAAERFCLRHQRIITRCLESRWRNSPLRALVADTTQEVVLECLRPGGALANLDRARCRSLEAYVRGVTRNVAARVERREAADHTHGRNAGAVIAAMAGPEQRPLDRVESDSVTDAIRRAVATLDEEPATPGHSLGELVRLHFGEGQPVRRIASHWHQPSSRVHELRRRACRLLRRLLASCRQAGD